MKFSVSYLFVLLSSIGLDYVVAHILEPVIENVVHLQTALPPPDVPGIWRKKLIWKARWVQEWKSAKTYRPLWRKVWSPVEIREWVPVPRPPPSPPSHSDADHLPDHPPGPTVAPDTPPEEPAPFRPLPPPTKYGPPPTGSTPLKPVTSPAPDWSAPDMQSLLSSYHTIREDPEDDHQNLERAPLNYHANPNSPTLSEFFEPPKASQSSQFRQNGEIDASGINNPVSPYAAKLAEAVIREKLKSGASEQGSGLTNAIYRAPTTPESAKSGAATDSPSNVYVVTPVSFG